MLLAWSGLCLAEEVKSLPSPMSYNRGLAGSPHWDHIYLSEDWLSSPFDFLSLSLIISTLYPKIDNEFFDLPPAAPSGEDWNDGPEGLVA